MDLLESLKNVGELGFKKIEIFFNTDSEMEKQFVSKIKKICKFYELQVVSVHFYTAAFESLMFFSAYSRRTADSMKRYTHYLDGIKELNPSYLTFHGERAKISGLSIDQLPFDKTVEVYNELCSVAEKFKMEIAQENVAWCRSNRPEYVLRLRESVPKLRFTLDVKQAIRSGQTVESYLEAMGNSLTNIHICDYNATDTCLLPGRGEMNFSNFFEKLKNNKYKNDVIIEVYSANYVHKNDIMQSGKLLQSIVNCQKMS
ncbi:MAG: sugar phosphate isomerase/epimerase [Clostridiales bacterium]|nr:sugar phosphate isomerase/epimerase [Clostridiales bacterium]